MERPRDDRCADGAAVYEFRVAGPLPALAARWLEDLQVEVGPGDSVRLRVAVADQASLYGLIGRLRDLGLVLVALWRSEPETPPSQPSK